MSTYLDDILQKLGWEDGFQIPVANSENQKLEEEVARLTLEKLKTKAAFETSNVKLENLENHLKYVNQESEQNQNLITVHIQQLQTEETKLKLDIAEKEKLEQDIRQFGKKIAEVNERQQVQKTQLEKYTRKLEKLKAEAHWDSEAIKAWEESLQKRDDDNELIKKFSKEDERKYNELEAKRQNLELEHAKRRQTVDKMICDINNYERVLERTGKVIQQQMTERNALIRQWKDSVRILHQRDEAIDNLQAQIFEIQEIIEKEQEKLEDQKQFYNNEVRNNDELEHENLQLNTINSRMRREMNELIQHINLLNSQADTLRRTMINTANQLEKQRTRRKCLKSEIEKKERNIEGYRDNLNILRQKSENLREATLSTEERTQHVEKLIDQEQKHNRILKNESEANQFSLFKAQQELQQQCTIGRNKQTEIYGATTNINHLCKHNEEKCKQIAKQREDLYQLDYKIDEIQRKMLLNENIIHNEDTEELEAKLTDLESKMGELTEIKNMLKDQVNKISDDMRRLTTAIFDDQQTLVFLKDKLLQQSLSFEGGQKQLVSLKSTIQEKQVEENILNLRVVQLRKAMKKEETSIYSLQKFKLTLEQATQERLLEIDTNKEILLVQKRNLSEDKGRLKCDIAERRIRLEQFQKKYDIVLMSLGKDEDGQPFSITQFKIKNAQDKFILQQEGDELDTKIKKAEQEILAMENTLKVVNLTNAAFKQSLGAVEDDGSEMAEMKMLEDQMLSINDVLRENRKNLIKKRQELEEIRSVLKELEAKRDEIKENVGKLEQEYLNVEQDIFSKEEKLKRTDHCLKILQKKINKKEKEKYDRNLEIRQLKDTNQSALQRLVELSVRYQEIAPLITRYTTEYDIKLPAKRSLSTMSTSSESTRSTPSCHTIKTPSVKSLTSESSKSSAISKVVLSFDI